MTVLTRSNLIVRSLARLFGPVIREAINAGPENLHTATSSMLGNDPAPNLTRTSDVLFADKHLAETFGERLRIAAGLIGGVAELARRTGIPHHHLYDYVHGRSFPEPARVFPIAGTCGVSQTWLSFDIGPMLLSECGSVAVVPRRLKINRHSGTSSDQCETEATR